MAADPTTMHPASGSGNGQEKEQEALKDTFPASDPVGNEGGRGSRAVPASEMQDEDPAPLADGKTVSYTFDSQEKAKLAGEGVVRAGLAERSRLTVDGSSLRLEVASNAAEDADKMLQQAGGRAS
ncbi:Hypothetical protein HVIM_02775 [Roseomonas mucosa]|uniref:Uncharacterized protein n=1 Tax=Roseomonas mucosa TaxID=207340 RepID=A0A1S8DAM8_9PROT|nr:MULTISPECIES: hypothetical protein [Roseomonas]MBS5901785.1 hypothetical protein [Acetobacteraceae bacterium]MCG7350410.1 hypothetical protein [Roseomonas mucosa]MCG7355711.1 hypothetical protein [Roseomonas mucosa]MDT8290666.1 hypothetical protein [Roseomonas mucosa]MDT8292479.1 hypothetical protein [Roseomonas mucosa]